MFALTSVAATTPAARRFSVGHGSSAQGRPMQRSTLVVAAAPRQPERREDGAPAGAFADGARKALAAALLSALLVAGPSTAAGLDTDTFKAGVKAKIEASDITKEKASDVVSKLKNEVLPDAANKLGKAAENAGSNYPDSIVQELRTVASEIEALDKQAKSGQDESVVKSAASGIEQQLNALKGILGFD